jgi:CheY-like chemotaxis protein
MTQSQPPKSIVLYADDDPDDIELVSQAFAEYSQNVELITFPDGIELLSHIDRIGRFEPRPCLAIIDINMPRIDGKETLRRLRKIDGFSDMPVVLFSTSTMPSDIFFAKRYNAGFVTKPLLAQQIHLIIDQLIEHCTDEAKKLIRKRDRR